MPFASKNILGTPTYPSCKKIAKVNSMGNGDRPRPKTASRNNENAMREWEDRLEKRAKAAAAAEELASETAMVCSEAPGRMYIYIHTYIHIVIHYICVLFERHALRNLNLGNSN